MSFARWWHSAEQWRQYLYVFGGKVCVCVSLMVDTRTLYNKDYAGRDDSEGTVVDSVEVFDVETGLWSHYY